jgi:hypothetical protein
MRPALFDWDRLEYLRDTSPWTSGSLTADDRVLASWGPYKIVYGPFGGVPNPSAQVVLLGLTPGMSQLKVANDIVRDAHRNGLYDPVAIGELRRTKVAFAGSMRSNAVTMLDQLGLQDALGIESCKGLFDVGNRAAYTTSALRYPVFVSRGAKLQNYSGRSITDHPIFQELLIKLLAPELAEVPQALIVPFGKSVEQAVMFLGDAGLLDATRVLRGFPHPSGANGHQYAQFQQNKDGMVRRITEWFSR